MIVKYIYSACLQITTSTITILTDPWFTEGAYDGAWYQFPQIDPFEFIQEPDYIYISHIHPDHYDPIFLHKLFDRFGVKPILIPDLKHNYLLSRGRLDGLSLTPTRTLVVDDVHMYIEENDTGSSSDIDSAFVVYDKKHHKTILNLNDCLYNKHHVETLQRIVKTFTNTVDLLCLGYTSAGGYPQTYFNLNTEKKKLIEEATIKKQNYFTRYREYVECFPATWNLPFAGEYVLGGRLSYLNAYRGVADAFEVTPFDDRAVVLNCGGYIDLSTGDRFDERQSVYSNDQLDERLDKLSNKKLDYETEINIAYGKIGFLRLLKTAAANANKRSEVENNYVFVISVTNNDSIQERFSIDCLTSEVREMDRNLPIEYAEYSEIIMDY